MTNTTESNPGQIEAAQAELGSKFIRWGLGQFLLGFVVGFVPIVHYIHGAVAGDVGPVFLKNMTLWWGCPAVLVEYVLKSGGLGMAAVGLCYHIFSRKGKSAPLSRGELMAPKLCLGGLILTLIWASVGYVVCTLIWTNFFFAPVQMGKNVWLAGQGIGIAIFVTGISYAISGIKRINS
jgi:hypothetical protein